MRRARAPAFDVDFVAHRRAAGKVDFDRHPHPQREARPDRFGGFAADRLQHDRAIHRSLVAAVAFGFERFQPRRQGVGDRDFAAGGLTAGVGGDQ